MAWWDPFKSKIVRVKPDPRVRWFGKLPTYADYYSSPANEAWVTEFNQWVLQGYDLYDRRRRESGGSPRLPSSTCIVRLPATKMTVLAAIEDFGGDMRGRPFPLCLFVGLSSLLWRGPTSARCTAAMYVLRELSRLRQLVVRFCNTPGQFESVFGGRDLSLDELVADTKDVAWMQAARSLPWADWFATVQGNLNGVTAEAWFYAVSAWGERINAHEAAEFAPTLRLPLGGALPLDVQVAGWLCWLEHRMDLERRFLSLFVVSETRGGAGHLGIAARDLVADDFLLATTLAGNLPYVDDASTLGVPAGCGDDPSKIGEARGDLSVRAPGTWADFVGLGAAIELA